MALTPQVRVSQADIVSIGEAAPDLRVSQMDIMAVANWPAEFVESSQLDTIAVTEAATDVEVSQLDIMVVGRGRVQDPYLRAWSYEMDTHWNYVLRLPTGFTIVYDQYAQQWYVWGSGTSTQWRPFHGTNWLNSGSLMDTYGSNVVCGDDGNGALYFLNPLSPTDDDAVLGASLPRTFQRIITGQVATRGNIMRPCYGVELGGSVGYNEADFTDITLSTSDDAGNTYVSRGTITVDPADYTARVDWNTGLGSYSSPGRLFRIEDDGAFQRIDWLEMADGPDGEENKNG